MSKVIIGLLMVLGGIAFGLWAGIWWAFIGGIVNVIEAVKASPVDAMSFATGVAKVFFAGVIGWLSALLLIIPGAGLIISAD